jgi:hypothetical protein
LATGLIIVQFFREREGEINKKKKILLNIALGLSLAIFLGTILFQDSESVKQDQKISVLLQRSMQDSIIIDELKATANEQSKNINQLKQKNDSLITKLATVEGMLAGTDKKVELGFSDNKFDLAQIKSKVGSTKKFITEEQKQFLIKELSRFKDFTIPIQYSSTSSVNADYAQQLKKIFIAAGIETWVNSMIGGYTDDSTLKGIVFIGRNHTEVTEEENQIYRIFHYAKLDVMAGFDREASYKFSIYVGD